MAHNCYKKAFKGTKFFPQRPHRQGIKFLKFVRVDGKTPSKAVVCSRLRNIPPVGTCRERSRLVGTFGRQTPATRVRDGRKVVCEIAESRARMRGKLSSHPGGTTVPPGWNTCTTKVAHLYHLGGTITSCGQSRNLMPGKCRFAACMGISPVMSHIGSTPLHAQRPAAHPVGSGALFRRCAR